MRHAPWKEKEGCGGTLEGPRRENTPEGPPDPEDPIRPEAVKGALGGSPFGGNILCLETLDSTNRLLKELASKGAPEGTVVVTEEQTLGRGRRGRTWLSPPRTNLLFSLLVRPSVPPEQAFLFTMILALAASDGVEEATGLRPLIKWPNDLYLGPKKLAGILTEFSLREGLVEYVVMGIGLNVNWNPEESLDVMYPAASLLSETGKRTDRNDLLVRILRRFEGHYGKVKSGGLEDVYRQWNDRSLILGREVVVESPEENITGRALRIDRSGALVILDDRGGERRILVGDVSLRLNLSKKGGIRNEGTRDGESP